MSVHIEENTAPDFSLIGIDGATVRLSDYRAVKHVVLVFNRGFMWPFCRRHMAQLRQGYQEFVERDAEVLVVGPEDRAAFEHYWQKESLPFVGLADPEHSVADLYGQEVKLLRLGRLPALVVVGKDGRIHYQHYGDSMQDIPANEEVLAVLDSLNGSNAS